MAVVVSDLYIPGTTVMVTVKQLLNILASIMGGSCTYNPLGYPRLTRLTQSCFLFSNLVWLDTINKCHLLFGDEKWIQEFK